MRRLLATLLALTVAAGCSFSAQELPLPGGEDLGDNPYTVTAEFDDVLDLVPRASVKVADVTVGEVDRIWLEDFTAKVSLKLKPGVDLPDNATARIRQTSLLGEKFVSLAPPTNGRYGELGNGDVIPIARTGRNVEVEEVLGALSLLLNGGGVAQLKTIESELNNALEGREESVKQLLRRLDKVLGELDTHKRDITLAIERLDRLAASLRKQKGTIATAIDDVPGALTILADQRKDLTKLLTELSALGKVGTRVIKSSKADLLANLESLDPVLTRLAESGDNLPKSLEVLFTYPFSDSAAKAIKGDYTNLQLTLDANLDELLKGKGPIQLPKLPKLPKLPVPTKLPLPTKNPLPLPTEKPKLPCLLPPLLCPKDSDSASGDAAPAAGAADAPSDAPSDPEAYDRDVIAIMLGGAAT